MPTGSTANSTDQDSTNQDGTDRPSAEPAWRRAEQAILDQLADLGRWEAELWAAGHERQLPSVSLTALRASYMQAAINSDGSDKSSYLEHAFGDIAKAVDQVAATTWTIKAAAGSEQRAALAETVTAVTEVAQLALAATVLAEELDDRALPENRRLQLGTAKARFPHTDAVHH